MNKFINNKKKFGEITVIPRSKNPRDSWINFCEL